ncbi:MAG: ECF transporter S component [Erysipelotrichaceae bacterium]|nr:ECF transporter S component [Erysipelotrichaceae bacterium]
MNDKTRKLVLTALLIAIGVVLPQAFHAIPNAGSIFLPMHIPVLIAGFAVGPFYGALCGILTPILSHLIFGMPPAMMLAQMVCELAMYGFMTGLLNSLITIKNPLLKNYVVLILSMLAGRLTYGILNALIFKAGSYSMQAWLSAAFISALPGIAIQLVLIPILVERLQKANLI